MRRPRQHPLFQRPLRSPVHRRVHRRGRLSHRVSVAASTVPSMPYTGRHSPLQAALDTPPARRPRGDQRRLLQGTPLDALTRALLAERRFPLAYAKGTAWGWSCTTCSAGTTRTTTVPTISGCPGPAAENWPSSSRSRVAKGHGPEFEYYRDGRLVNGVDFETHHCGVGTEPELLAPALTAARLIGPEAEFDLDGREERLVRAISDFFDLPELDLSQTELADTQLP